MLSSVSINLLQRHSDAFGVLFESRWLSAHLDVNAVSRQVVAEYALRGINKPIGISQYELTEKLPAALKGKLPTIEEIEAELNNAPPEE